VYTCGPFDPQIVFNFLKAFSPVSVEWKYIDREFDLKTLDVGSWSDESNKQLNLFNNRKT
jgi:S-adenosylmethionine/arginine decarboxylase-like enzyme